MKKILYLIANNQLKGFSVSIAKGFLWILSYLYFGVLTLRAFLYQAGVLHHYRLGRPVISVGNITLGGTGKTPLVIWVARELQKRNLKPVILTRGYMDKRGKSSDEQSDEARLMAKSLGDVPVLVGPNRVRNAKNFLKSGQADVFILDDGFQHWPLARDLDIVTLDATDPWGNGHLIPRGILREPLRSLSRAGAIVLTKTDLKGALVDEIMSRLGSVCPNAMIVESIHDPMGLTDLRCEESRDLSVIKGKKVCAFCSLGDPQSLRKTLINLGADVLENIAFMDHHCYNRDDIARIVQRCRDNSLSTLVTTEKDAVKLTSLIAFFDQDMEVLSLKINIRITQKEYEFKNILERAVHLS